MLSARQGSGSESRKRVDCRSVVVAAATSEAFRPILRIGGDTGWYFGGWLWRLRGHIDLFLGGPGHRRGRRDPETLRPGDVLDTWRVEAIEPDRLLRLRAEMKLPGQAWLQFDVTDADAGSQIRQTATFLTAGLPGLVYWYALLPVHRLIFRGMLRGIAAEVARQRQGSRSAA